MTSFRVFVRGTPSPQGSKTAFMRGGRPVIVDQNPGKLKPWREAVRSTLVDRLPDNWAPLTGPVHVTIEFVLQRPASAPKRRRTWPIKARSGDLDKLVRAVLDAATDAGIWVDDSQVISITASKDWAPDGVPGAQILITHDGQDLAW